MVGREGSEVLDLHVVSLPVGVGGALVGAVTGCGTAQDARIGICRVIDPNDNALPVVAVTTGNVTGVRLVLGEVPRVHDSKLALVPGGTSIDLAFVSVTTSGTDIASILKTSTVDMFD